MLAALAGFERKNDKYIMQRLIRMGDINKVSADVSMEWRTHFSHSHVQIQQLVYLDSQNSLCKKCPYLDFLWYEFSHIWTGYGDLQSKSPY